MDFQVAAILQKSETDRTAEETGILVSCSDVVKEVNLRYSHFENHWLYLHLWMSVILLLMVQYENIDIICESVCWFCKWMDILEM